LSKGTRFSIYPFNTTDFTDQSRQVAIAEITQIEASESTAKILAVTEGGIEVTTSLEPGAPAVMLSAPVGLVQRVRFFSEKIAGDQEQDLPTQLVETQQAALDRVRQALANNGWVVEVKTGEAALFQVAIDREGNYEICQSGSPILNLHPSLSITDSLAPKRVCDRLIHLAKYQAVQSIDNASSKLAQAIAVEILKEDKTTFDDPQNPTVQAEEIIYLRLTNQGNQILKVAVLDLEPTWAVSQLAIAGMDSPFYNLEAGAQEDIPLRMTMPENVPHQQTKDTFKVFAVQKGLADFRWLTLPPLDEPPAARAAELEQAEQRQIITGNATRSMAQSETVNPLNHLLKMIGADLDQAPQITRAGVVVTDPKQEWVTKQISVTVRRNE
jgi:hypothetical protein